MDNDDNLFVKFYEDSVQNNFESTKAGHPVFEDKVFVSIIVPGSADQMNRIATDADKERFPKQWATYERNAEDPVDGWKIDQWTLLTPARVNDLRHMNFHTVEQLAAASDTQISKLMGGQDLRAKAQAALALAEDQAAVQVYAAENERLKTDIDDLRRQVDELAKTKRSKAA